MNHAEMADTTSTEFNKPEPRAGLTTDSQRRDPPQRRGATSSRPASSFAILAFVVIVAIGAALSFAIYGFSANVAGNWITLASVIVGFIVMFAIKVADQWDRAVVLRLGRFHVLQGPGLFWIMPIFDAIPYWIDTRVITSAFKAERTLPRTPCRSM